MCVYWVLFIHVTDMLGDVEVSFYAVLHGCHVYQAIWAPYYTEGRGHTQARRHHLLSQHYCVINLLVYAWQWCIYNVHTYKVIHEIHTAPPPPPPPKKNKILNATLLLSDPCRSEISCRSSCAEPHPSHSNHKRQFQYF